MSGWFISGTVSPVSDILAGIAFPVPGGPSPAPLAERKALFILRQLAADSAVSAAQLASWPLFELIRRAGLLDSLLGEQAS
jgi:hypothetical protein